MLALQTLRTNRARGQIRTPRISHVHTPVEPRMGVAVLPRPEIRRLLSRYQQSIDDQIDDLTGYFVAVSLALRQLVDGR